MNTSRANRHILVKRSRLSHALPTIHATWKYQDGWNLMKPADSRIVQSDQAPAGKRAGSNSAKTFSEPTPTILSACVVLRLPLVTTATIIFLLQTSSFSFATVIVGDQSSPTAIMAGGVNVRDVDVSLSFLFSLQIHLRDDKPLSTLALPFAHWIWTTREMQDEKHIRAYESALECY